MFFLYVCIICESIHSIITEPLVFLVPINMLDFTLMLASTVVLHSLRLWLSAIHVFFVGILVR